MDNPYSDRACRPWSGEQVLRCGPFLLDLRQQVVCMNGQEIELPPCAFACLAALVRSYPSPVTYKGLVAESLGIRLGALEAQDYSRWRITRLREAIENNPLKPHFIRTVPGCGYRLEV